jgi:hypothetical protein
VKTLRLSSHTRAGLYVRSIAVLALLAIPVATSTQSDALPGMPPLLDQHDVYAGIRPGPLHPSVKDFPSLVYVPNSGDNTVDVIDPKTFKIIDHFDASRSTSRRRTT